MVCEINDLRLGTNKNTERINKIYDSDDISHLSRSIFMAPSKKPGGNEF